MARLCSRAWPGLLLLSCLSEALALVTSSAWVSTRHTSNSTFRIHDHGGVFTGTQFLAHALTHDMPKDLQARLEGCNVHMRGDAFNPRHDGVPDWGPEGRTWIVVNGEPFWSDAIRDTAYTWMHPNDKLVILGTWVNESTAEVMDDRMTSLWVPYASLYFADRRDRTPMDLLERGILQESPAAAASRFQQSIDHERIVAYLHRHCEDKREAAWDALNDQLHSLTGHYGSALGSCNGKKNLGRQIRSSDEIESEIDYLGNLRIQAAPEKSYNDAEQMYQDFLFTMAIENEVNKVGYISEKIVNAYLAGTVPVYDGAKQIGTLFNTDSFLHVNSSITTSVSHLAQLLRDPGAYERLRRPVAGVVSNQSLRSFFSWHPAVWPSHGDGLRRRILEEVAKHCTQIQPPASLILKEEDADPTSSISHLVQWAITALDRD